MGQGQAPHEAYECARAAAAALLAGNVNASALSTVNKVFLESCMSALNTVNPLFFRLGGGREGPDGSVSFLVRFAGREQGITGELFVRLEEKRPAGAAASPEGAAPDLSEAPPSAEAEIISDGEDDSPMQAPVAQTPAVPATLAVIPGGKAWVFEDLILEEARSREAENKESRHRYDFPPYERFF